jgi:hypothetical protein
MLRHGGRHIVNTEYAMQMVSHNPEHRRSAEPLNSYTDKFAVSGPRIKNSKHYPNKTVFPLTKKLKKSAPDIKYLLVSVESQINKTKYTSHFFKTLFQQNLL